MTWAMTLLPAALLLAGFPIYITLLATCAVVIVFFYSIPGDRAAPDHVRLAGQFRAFGGAVLHIGRRDHGHGRHFAPPGRLVAIAVRRHARQPADHHHLHLRCVRLDFRLVRRNCRLGRPDHLQADDRRRLRPQIRDRPADGIRPDRQHDPAVDRDDPVRRGRGAIGRATFSPPGSCPGILFALAFAAYVWIKGHRSAVDRPEPFSIAPFTTQTGNAFWALGLPVLILGGIYSGIITATEAGGIACVYAVLVSVLIYREIRWTELGDLAHARELHHGAGDDRARGSRRLFLAADDQRRRARPSQPSSSNGRWTPGCCC